MEPWQAQASALFFVEHMRVNTIATVVKRSRETVSRFITGCEGYAAEMSSRKALSKEQRKKYQGDWDKANRPDRYRVISGDTLRQEHEMAVRELSAEKYH